MKKLLFINLIVFLAVLCILNQQILAVESEDDEIIDFLEIENVLQTVSSVSNFPDTSSSHIIAFDRQSKRILFEKDGFSKTPMASTTKILTAIIAIENSNLEEKVSISKEAENISGSTLGIISNTQMTMKDLLYGLLLRSGNDCAVAIAEHIGGNIQNFSSIMNKKALSLGLKNSNFTSPHGLDDENHYTTAYELALITDYALENKIFREIVSTKQASVRIGNITKTISNTNELLGNYEGIYGVKTGFTFNAGRCLVTACNKNNLDIILVVLGADSKKTRTLDSIKVLNYIYNNFTKLDISNIIYEEFGKFENYFTSNTTIKKSTDKPNIKLENIKNTIFPIQKNELNFVSSEIYTLNKLESPSFTGKKIGELKIKVNNETLISTNILLANNITRKNWYIYFKEILIAFFN